MRSIYGLMTESNQQDSVIKDNYPDVLTLPLQDFSFNSPPKRYDIEERDLIRPDLMMTRNYNISELDDLLLFINDIGFLPEEELGQALFIPTKKSIERFFNRNFV